MPTSAIPVSTPSDPPVLKVGAHLRTDLDLSHEELLHVLDLAAQMKATPAPYSRIFAGRYLSLLFDKPSLRTRLTFELAIKQLGGDAVVCSSSNSGPLGGREPIKDMARNLDRWTHGIVARVFSQSTIDELAKWSRVPVINALSDMYHPCQALANAQTLKQHFGRWEGLKLAFIGDGNNVAHSLMITACRLGIEVAVATPPRYEPDLDVTALAQTFGKLTITNDPRAAVKDAHAVYTDVWASMGQEEEAESRARVFAPYQVNEALMAQARPEAVFMHCLPAHRGEEVTDGVIESSTSLVFDEAENRLHAQKALLVALLDS
ncbi:MAG: ornithine carbamoyltransferase [Acidobacteriota bacterium]